MASSVTVAKKVLTLLNIKHLQDSAAIHHQQNNFQKAVETLEIIINHVEGWNKLQPSIDLAEYLLSLRSIPEVENVCVLIASIIDANQSSRLIDHIRDVCDENIMKLVFNLVNVGESDRAIFLTGYRFQFVKNHYDGESSLDKLQGFGWLMAQISKQLSIKDKKEQIKQQYTFMDEILNFMQNINNVDLKVKCLKITFFLCRFGLCCIEAADWYKSIEKNVSAIKLIRKLLYSEANRHAMFGYCHHNMGVALENTNQLVEAKSAYIQAIEIYKTANDWSNEEDKLSNIYNSLTSLEMVKRKIILHNPF